MLADGAERTAGIADSQVHLGAFAEGRVELAYDAAIRTQVVVALSGGMDSTVCAALAVRDYRRRDSRAHISYGQRTEEPGTGRLSCDLRPVAGSANVSAFRTPFFRAIGGSALTDDRDCGS